MYAKAAYQVSTSKGVGNNNEVLWQLTTQEATTLGGIANTLGTKAGLAAVMYGAFGVLKFLFDALMGTAQSAAGAVRAMFGRLEKEHVLPAAPW